MASASASLITLRVFAVGDQHLGFGVVEGEGEDRRVEPGVERVEHGAGHRHAVVGLDHPRRVREHHRNRVAGPDSLVGERRGEAARAGVKLGIGEALRPVDHRGTVGKHDRRAFEESQRRERLKVRGVAVKVDVVNSAHGESRRVAVLAMIISEKSMTFRNAIQPAKCRVNTKAVSASAASQMTMIAAAPA